MYSVCLQNLQEAVLLASAADMMLYRASDGAAVMAQNECWACK